MTLSQMALSQVTIYRHESIPHDQKKHFKIGLESKTRPVQKHDCSNHHIGQSTFWSLQIYQNPNRKGTKTNLILDRSAHSFLQRTSLFFECSSFTNVYTAKQPALAIQTPEW